MTAHQNSRKAHQAYERCNQSMMPGGTPIGELDLSPVEFSILCAARFFFASFAEPNSQSWLSVVLSSEDFFPKGDSPLIVKNVLTMVHELRTSRKSVLRFSSPRCIDCSAILTAEERHIIMMLKELQRGSHSSASTHAMLLCEGNETGGLLKASETLLAIMS